MQNNWICIKEYLNYIPGEVIEAIIVKEKSYFSDEMDEWVYAKSKVTDIGYDIDWFDPIDLEIYFISLAEWRQAQINSILEDDEN